VTITITGFEERKNEKSASSYWDTFYNTVKSAITQSDTHIVYKIKTVFNTGDCKEYETCRRYNEFESLLTFLRAQPENECRAIPPLPEKYLNNQQQSVVEDR
jgi:hypothetical protein